MKFLKRLFFYSLDENTISMTSTLQLWTYSQHQISKIKASVGNLSDWSRALEYIFFGYGPDS